MPHRREVLRAYIAQKKMEELAEQEAAQAATLTAVAPVSAPVPAPVTVMPVAVQPEPVERPVATGMFNGVKKMLRKREMEKGIEALLNSARGHEQNQLPPGSEPYRLLNQRANELVQRYVAVANTTEDLVTAQIPALAKLREFATGSANQARKRPGPIAILSLAGLASFAISLILAMCNVEYHWVVKFFHAG